MRRVDSQCRVKWSSILNFCLQYSIVFFVNLCRLHCYMTHGSSWPYSDATRKQTDRLLFDSNTETASHSTQVFRDVLKSFPTLESFDRWMK